MSYEAHSVCALNCPGSFYRAGALLSRTLSRSRTMGLAMPVMRVGALRMALWCPGSRP
jgi:hypothetical protein